MRAHQLFADMSPHQAAELLKSISEAAPACYAQAVVATGAALNARPGFIIRQPPEKRANMVRRTLARIPSNDFAEEVLATYFIECRKDTLVEWLDLVGLQHEDGILSEDAPDPPSESRLREAIATFRQAEDDQDRELLLLAFAAQSAIRWPVLDAILAES